MKEHSLDKSAIDKWLENGGAEIVLDVLSIVRLTCLEQRQSPVSEFMRTGTARETNVSELDTRKEKSNAQ